MYKRQIDELPRRSRRRGDWGGRNRGNDDNQQRGNRGGDRSERERGNRGGDDERRNNWTREYDLDGDGDLGEAERALLRDEWRNRRDNENARGNREGGGEAGGGARGGGRGGRGGDN